MSEDAVVLPPGVPEVLPAPVPEPPAPEPAPEPEPEYLVVTSEEVNHYTSSGYRVGYVMLPPL